MLQYNIINLRNIIKNSGLEQKQIASMIGINVIHFNKVLNGKAVFTSKLAHKLAKISIFKTNVHDLLYPDCKNYNVGKVYKEEDFL